MLGTARIEELLAELEDCVQRGCRGGCELPAWLIVIQGKLGWSHHVCPAGHLTRHNYNFGGSLVAQAPEVVECLHVRVGWEEFVS